MEAAKLVRVVLTLLTQYQEAKQDDGKIDASEAIEIALSGVGSAFGIEGGKLAAWIQATRDLFGDDLSVFKLSFLEDK